MNTKFLDNFNHVFNNDEIVLSETFDQFLSIKYSELEFDKRHLQNKISIKYEDLDFYKFEDLTYFETTFRNAHYECFLNKKISSRLIVMLSAARTKPQLPRFQRISYSTITNDNYLFIEDPTYYLNNELKVGWYFGDKDNNFYHYTSQLVRKISKILNIEDKNVIFFGSSCAGTAAIAISEKFSKSSTAISINGQINFEYYHKDITSFEKIMNFQIKNDSENRGDIISKIQKSYTGMTDNKIILIENVASRWDRQDHLQYLINKLNIKVKYPITKHENLYIWMYYAKTANSHVAHDDKELFPLIYSIILQISDKDQNLDVINKHCQIINYIWKLHYDKDNNCIFNFVNEFEYKHSLELFHHAKLNIKTSDTDNYNHYEFPLINKGYYSIDIDNAHSSSCKEFSIGLFDKKTHSFLFLNEYSTHTTIKINFFLCSSNTLYLDIFAGKHGSTRNIELNISDIFIYYIKA